MHPSVWLFISVSAKPSVDLFVYLEVCPFFPNSIVFLSQRQEDDRRLQVAPSITVPAWTSAWVNSPICLPLCHIFNHFFAHAHIFHKAFMALLGISRGCLETLMVIWPFFYTTNLKGLSLEPDKSPFWPLKIVAVGDGSVWPYCVSIYHSCVCLPH